MEARIAGKTQTQAAIEAGAAASAAPRGSRLARRSKVIEAIKSRREVVVTQAEEATNITVSRLFDIARRVL